MRPLNSSGNGGGQTRSAADAPPAPNAEGKIEEPKANHRFVYIGGELAILLPGRVPPSRLYPEVNFWFQAITDETVTDWHAFEKEVRQAADEQDLKALVSARRSAVQKYLYEWDWKAPATDGHGAPGDLKVVDFKDDEQLSRSVPNVILSAIFSIMNDAALADALEDVAGNSKGQSDSQTKPPGGND